MPNPIIAQRRRADDAPDLESLAASAQAGARDALDALLTALLPRMRNLVRYLIRNDHEVDDITQDALFSIVRGLPSFRGSGTFVSWSDRITARTTFARVRQRRASAQAVAAQVLAFESDVPAEDHAGDFLARRALVGLLDDLPEEQREALVLHDVLEMPPAEIAEELGLPVETVRSRVRLAKAKLRDRARNLRDAVHELPFAPHGETA